MATVLIVDDNPDFATSLAILLQLKGHQTHTCGHGLDCFEILGQLKPDVMLLDLGLPGKTGYTIARELKDRRDVRPKLLIAVTGFGKDSDRAKTAECGFDHHLLKPFEIDELEQIIAQAKLGPATR